MRVPLRRRSVPLLVAAAALLVSATAAWACSCYPFETPEAQLDASQLAFVGRVEWTRRERGRPQGLAVTRFTVIETIKGEPRAARQIAHHLDGATCGVTFRPGERVILFARPNEGRYATGLCDMARFPLEDYRAAAES